MVECKKQGGDHMMVSKKAYRYLFYDMFSNISCQIVDVLSALILSAIVDTMLYSQHMGGKIWLWVLSFIIVKA